MWDVVEAVRSGKAKFEWAEIESRVGDDRLYISVMRDAIRFDDVPAMNWHRNPVAKAPDTFNGVRVPATAAEMQQIADMLFCMLPTPKILDLVWSQATLKFDPIINLGSNKIVATQNINDVHEAIEKKIVISGGYPAHGIIASVGKYWVLSNKLSPKSGKYGASTSCNYGWHSSTGIYPAVTNGMKVWQGEGTAHNDAHVDPSQVIRLIYRMARLVRSDGSTERVDLHGVAADSTLSLAINHSGVLKTLRQPSVPEPVLTEEDGVVFMPETVIYPGIPPAEMDSDQLSKFLKTHNIA